MIEPVKSNQEEVQFVLDTHRLAGKLTLIMPKAEKKTGKTLISSDQIVKIRRRIIDENTQTRELRSEYPQLVVDVFLHTATLNDEKLELEPSPEDIKNDVELFLKYMQGYERFHGNVSELQQRYYEFANWFSVRRSWR